MSHSKLRSVRHDLRESESKLWDALEDKTDGQTGVLVPLYLCETFDGKQVQVRTETLRDFACFLGCSNVVADW